MANFTRTDKRPAAMLPVRFSLVSAMAMMLVSAGMSATTAQEETDEPDINAVIESNVATFRIETVGEGYERPWSMAFISETQALLGEREKGKITLMDLAPGETSEITGLPDMYRSRSESTGMFDIELDPGFAENRLLYIAYAVGEEKSIGLAVSRYRLDGSNLVDGKLLLETDRFDGKWHFGGRLAISGDYLFLSTGDGYEHRNLSQDLSSHAGKILRIHLDGRFPSDNPFAGTDGAMPEIFALGARNPQGMATDPATGDVWMNEHGPQGGDEVNLVASGVNFGWPVTSYGIEYEGGPVGDGITHKDGMTQPVWFWRPSIAPSGMEIYRGDAFPGWNGSLFSGAMAHTHINRLVIEEGRVIHEERLLADFGWRVRFVETGPDGYLYFGVDDGMIMRLVPATVEE